MSQSRLSSFYEALINIVIGFSLNYVFNLILIPMFVTGQDGKPVVISHSANFWMGCAFTVVSLARSYVIRRYFNARLQRLAQQMAGKQ